MATEEETKGDSNGGKKPHFFKVFLPGLTSEKLEIPPAFRKHMEAGIRSCFLTGPSGNVWTVAVAKSQTGSLCFADGWKRFAEDHAMETGEFFVFIYLGAACFRLLIFDTSACEKQSAFRAAPSQIAAAADGANSEEKVKNKREGTRGGLSAAAADGADAEEKVKSEREGKRGGLSAPSAAAAAGPVTSRPENKCRGRGGEGSPPNAGVCTSPQNNAGDGDAPEGSNTPPARPDLRKITYARKRSRGLLVSQRRPVTSEEIEAAHSAANAFTSENPSHVIILRKTGVYIGHSIPLPHSFAKSYLSKNPQKITLSDSRGNEWEVNFLPLENTFIFSAGWRQFSLDNYLEQDDACVFEVIGKDKIRVHIFRVVEEVKPLMRRVVKK